MNNFSQLETINAIPNEMNVTHRNCKRTCQTRVYGMLSCAKLCMTIFPTLQCLLITLFN